MITFLLKIFVKDYKDTSNPLVRKKYGLLGSIFGLISNLIIVAIKVFFGIITATTSMIADSLNNISDLGNNMISIFGFKYANKKADDNHPYGHQRLEYIISLILGTIIIILGAFLLYNGVSSLISFIKSMIETSRPEAVSITSLTIFVFTLSFLIFTVLIKLIQSYLYYDLGKRISSMQLKVLSKDSRNDVIATIFVIIGLIISYFTGYSIDCFFTMAVSIFVIISGINIVKEAAIVLIGQKPNKEIIEKIKEIILKDDNVLGIHDLNIHYYGDVAYGSIDIEIDEKTTLINAHKIADRLEKIIFAKLGISMSIHIDPINNHDPETKKMKLDILNLVQAKEKLLSIHDFKYDKENKIISFDLVIPSTIQSVEKEEITNTINNYLKSIDSSIELKITFDDIIRDFL